MWTRDATLVLSRLSCIGAESRGLDPVGEEHESEIRDAYLAGFASSCKSQSSRNLEHARSKPLRFSRHISCGDGRSGSKGIVFVEATDMATMEACGSRATLDRASVHGSHAGAEILLLR